MDGYLQVITLNIVEVVGDNKRKFCSSLTPHVLTLSALSAFVWQMKVMWIVWFHVSFVVYRKILLYFIRDKSWFTPHFLRIPLNKQTSLNYNFYYKQRSCQSDQHIQMSIMTSLSDFILAWQKKPVAGLFIVVWPVSLQVCCGLQ